MRCSPGDDALHLKLLVVLLFAQPVLRVLQSSLVLQEHLLCLLILALHATFILLQLFSRNAQLLLQDGDLLLILRRE